MDFTDFDPLDPERNLKRLNKTVGVSVRIQKLTTNKRRSIKIETKEEKIEKILKQAKDDRSGRNLQVGLRERYLIDLISTCLGVDEETLMNCAVDSDQNIKMLSNLFDRDGSFQCLIQFQLDDAPSIESGRFDPKLKNTKVKTALFSDGKGKKIIGKCAVAYRLQNSSGADAKSVADDLLFTILPEDENVISSIYTSLLKTIRPALEASKEYGNCTDSQRLEFLFGVDSFLGFLKSTKNDLISCTIKFDVNNELFKGFLLAPHQIVATSKRRDKVAEVEEAFKHWLRQITVVISQCKQIVLDTPEAGPLKELEHWRMMLTKVSNVFEFTDSRPFQSYMRCLKLSRSKLIRHWEQTEGDLNALRNEARDNVKYMTSIEKYWDPLYRCNPPEIAESLSHLLQSIRTVFNTSRFYNTSLRITGFLSKVVNQLIIASQSYLTNKGTITIWDEKMNNFVKKINDCKKLMESFRFNYEKVIADMAEADEEPFNCSEKFLFERLTSFELRLNSLREIMEVYMRYRVLDRIKIVGMEPFSERIKSAFKVVSEKSYDPLAHRLEEFDADYEEYLREISLVEHEMEAFVKKYVEPIELVEMRLLTLKRFERLNLVCLCLDRRYLDAAEMLEKEITDLKDKYNEDRGNPPISANVPKVVGRIMWVRMLLNKIEVPLKQLQAHPCVIEHPRAQLCVKHYNSLTAIFMHYEAMHHKTWFSYAEQVRSKLEQPLIRKNLETNHYEVNLNRHVLQIVKETECMQKLGLEVPKSCLTLAYCKDKVIRAFEKTTALLDRNNKLRRSIYPMFVPLMRIQLIKLERVFAPALSTVTWLSQNLEAYFKQIIEVLRPVECLLKEVSDMNDAQIEVCMKFIEDSVLIYLPDEPVTPQELKELNENYRKQKEKKIEMKSLVAEKAAVDLINLFVAKSELADYDDSGKFQLPPDKINEDNWRAEEFKPINKYDWLSFEKLYKAVGYAAPDENEEFCFKDYDGLKYDVTLLHIDCVELFAYYNHKVIAALAKATKRSMEMFKKRSDINSLVLSLSCDQVKEKPLIKASIVLKIPEFVLVPSMPELQKYYESVLQNIIETNYAVSTWGKQAKTKERKQRRPLIDEVRHERHWFKTISEHKEVSRYKIGFDNGVMQLDAKVKSIMSDLSDEYKYLWDASRDDGLDKFIQEKPLMADIRDMFKKYDGITCEIQKLDKVLCMRTIEINRELMIASLEEESKAWKTTLGKKLNSFYRDILNETCRFIQIQQRVLIRDITSLDHCRTAMMCMELIRENFFQTDQNVDLLEEGFSMLASFNIDIAPEDSDRVYGLRYDFNTMMSHNEMVSKRLHELQEPLQHELEAGSDQLRLDVAQFDEEFTTRGPMVPGITANEAIYRVALFEARLAELGHRHDIYSSGQKLYGLPVNEYPVMEKRKGNIDLLNQYNQLTIDFMRCIDKYSKTIFKELDMDTINGEMRQFLDRCYSMPQELQDWQALIDLTKRIEDFIGLCPIIEIMTPDAVKTEHWRKLEAVTGRKFDIQSLNFTLGEVLKTPLLKFKHEIEEICVAAIQEDKEKRQL